MARSTVGHLLGIRLGRKERRHGLDEPAVTGAGCVVGSDLVGGLRIAATRGHWWRRRRAQRRHEERVATTLVEQRSTELGVPSRGASMAEGDKPSSSLKARRCWVCGFYMSFVVNLICR
jgi:hypothetical protein